MNKADRARVGSVPKWQRLTPYMAVVWSLVYTALGIYWAVGGPGFPYTHESTSTALGPVAGRLGPDVAWIVVMMAGIPAAVVGVVMLGVVRSKPFRPLFIASGVLTAGVLLLLMTDINLLILLGYIPYTIRSLFTGAAFSQDYLEVWTQWATIHQVLCLTGGFLWLAATVSYARRSGGACLHCGRQDSPEGWTSPIKTARWGRIALYVSIVAPVFYALTRYAWALGFPLGISEAYLRWGQEKGMWTSGLFLATFGLVGAALSLGLAQRWGEVFPHWMIGLAGRRVPIALAVVPASLVSVLLIVGGITMWSSLDQMVAASAASGAVGSRLIWEIIVLVGPVLLFPVWGVALAVATLGYYYRRRGPCSVCGRGESGDSVDALLQGPKGNKPMKYILTLLCLAVLLTGCAWSTPPAPTPTQIPTPQSQRISEFVWQHDGDYAYGMLRPANWLSANEGTQRVYYPNFQDDQMRLALNVVNIKVISNQLPEGAVDVRWTLYRQHPSLEGWTNALVPRLYKRDVIHLEHSLDHARIYSVRTTKFGQHIRLVAYGIDHSTPFEIILDVGGEQALLEEIDQTGLMDDFITMVESFRTAP